MSAEPGRPKEHGHEHEIPATPATNGTGSDHPRCMFIVVMGVSGTGKSTLGNALANALHMPYVEGDDLHPKINVDKMSDGIPLTDADREPWLELVRKAAEQHTVEGQFDLGSETDEASKKGCHGVVITCSALKRYYRDILRGRLKPASRDAVDDHPQPLPEHMEPPHPDVLPTYFVFIKGERDLILHRMESRPGHFMKAGMLDSQLKTLETPEGEEGVVVVNSEEGTEEQVRKAKEGLGKIVGEWFLEFVDSVS